MLVFDYTKHPSKPKDAERNICKPNLRLKGHTKQGYGLAWSTHEPGKLVSAGDDHLICYWDIGATTPGSSSSSSSSSSSASSSSAAASAPSGTVLHASKVIRGHTDVVEDVAWHRFSPHLIGSCGDDRLLLM